MKKIYKPVLIILAGTLMMLSFSACTSKSIQYDEGIYANKDWSETVGSYTSDVVNSKETAIQIAVAVYNGMDKSNDMDDLTPTSVFYDEQDEIWIISFSKKSAKNEVGGDCSIAIQKEDGKVLRIWFGE